MLKCLFMLLKQRSNLLAVCMGKLSSWKIASFLGNHVFPVNICPGFMITTPSLSPFSIVLSTQRFSNCSSTVDGFVQLSLDCFCGNRVLKMNTEFSCHLYLFNIWPEFSCHLYLFNICQSLSLSFVFQPLSLLADDVFPWFMHAIITLQTVDLYRCSSMFTAPTICPLWKSDKSPILLYFHMNCY